ncbi:MAG TPA: glycosyltransferase [Thermoanaerobacterales bacterium]|jgi:glycosyltransferase involved in cell wall biosynthesis|nr:glycosyltransferase [Thermoanaerobacterales bacterium]
MNIAVVPARNEQGRIGKVVTLLCETKIEKVIVVVNGSFDNTMREIKSLKRSNVEILYFKQTLGIDIPRSIGAYAAFKQGADSVVFVDGDMIGDILALVNDLVFAIISNGIDLAMTNCYPDIYMPYGNELTEQILTFRALLNMSLGIYRKVGVATPSHGPHAVSRRLLEHVDFRDFAVPPVVLAFAVKHGFSVDVAGNLHQNKLGSKIKNYSHAKKIADTIIGDTLEALYYFNDKPRSRKYLYREFLGYNPGRRFDILEKILKKY